MMRSTKRSSLERIQTCSEMIAKTTYELASLLWFKGLKHPSELDPIGISKRTVDWSVDMLARMNCKLEVTGAPVQTDRPTLFVSNHISYLDIPLWLSQVPKTSFVSKKSVRYWPIIGLGAEIVGTTFVSRDSKDSRQATTYAIGRTLTEQNRSVVIFPEGTSGTVMRPWKFGSFAVAQKYNIPVQAARLAYDPARPAAYQDDDTFAAHVYNLLGYPEIKVSMEFHEPVMIQDVRADTEKLYQWCHASYEKKLKDWGYESSKQANTLWP